MINRKNYANNLILKNTDKSVVVGTTLTHIAGSNCGSFADIADIGDIVTILGLFCFAFDAAWSSLFEGRGANGINRRDAIGISGFLRFPALLLHGGRLLN